MSRVILKRILKPIFNPDIELKKAKRERVLIHNNISSPKRADIINSYEIMAEAFFLRTQKKNNEIDTATFEQAIRLYNNTLIDPNLPVENKLSQFGLKTNSISDLFATTQTMLAIITYLKDKNHSELNDSFTQERNFLNQAHDFILAAYSTANSLNEYRQYKNSVIQRSVLTATTGTVGAVSSIFAINSEALLTGAFLAALGGTVTGVILLAAALVIIASIVTAAILIHYEKKQLQQELIQISENESHSITSKQRDMLNNFKDIRDSRSQAANNYLLDNLSAVLLGVQQAEEDFVPAAELRK